ncbi:MAG: MATE family efflux transporter [Terricaulis sp.]
MIAAAAGFLSAGAMWLGGEALFTSFGIDASLAAPSARVMAVLALSIPLHLAYVAATFFLEAIKKPGISTVVMWIANAVNLALNFAFVPEHGAVGSAWATVGARFFLAAVTLFCIWRLRDAATFGVDRFGGKGPNYRALLAVGIAAAVSQAVEAGAFTAMTVIAGRLGGAAVAAYQILLNVMSLVFMVALGLSTAAAVLVAEAVGRGAPRDAARAGWTALALTIVAMALFALAVFLFPNTIGRVYTADISLAALTAASVWIVAFVFLPDGAQVVAASALRARGDNWFPTFSHILAYAVVMPPLGYFLAEYKGLGVDGLIFAIFAASIVSALVLVARWAVLSRAPSPNARP